MDHPLSVDGSVGRLWSLVLPYRLMMMRLLFPDGPTSLSWWFSWLALVFGFGLPYDDELIGSWWTNLNQLMVLMVGFGLWFCLTTWWWWGCCILMDQPLRVQLVFGRSLFSISHFIFEMLWSLVFWEWGCSIKTNQPLLVDGSNWLEPH